MKIHLCRKLPPCADLWRLGIDGETSRLTIEIDFDANSRGLRGPVSSYQSVEIPVSYCPWCGERLVEDDD